MRAALLISCILNGSLARSSSKSGREDLKSDYGSRLFEFKGTFLHKKFISDMMGCNPIRKN